jgi:RNA 2',3'-cyclic 3'-phosphodiesterase
MNRLFVAIDLDPALVRELESIQYGLPGVRWTPPEQLHLTLRFIPEASNERLDMLQENLGEIEFAPFELRTGGLGVFLRRQVAEILYCSVQTSPELLELQRRVDGIAREIGLAGEKRRFEPHVTLARLKDAPPARLEEYLSLHQNFPARASPVNEFSLYSSVLRPEGAVHRRLESYPATAAAGNS